MKLARSTYYYRPRRVGTTVEKKIARLCVEFPRYGYRRITAHLRSVGTQVNHKALTAPKLAPQCGLASRVNSGVLAADSFAKSIPAF
jgi:hypothetical protein